MRKVGIRTFLGNFIYWEEGQWDVKVAQCSSAAFRFVAERTGEQLVIRVFSRFGEELIASLWITPRENSNKILRRDRFELSSSSYKELLKNSAILERNLQNLVSFVASFGNFMNLSEKNQAAEFVMEVSKREPNLYLLEAMWEHLKGHYREQELSTLIEQKLGRHNFTWFLDKPYLLRLCRSGYFGFPRKLVNIPYCMLNPTQEVESDLGPDHAGTAPRLLLYCYQEGAWNLADDCIVEDSENYSRGYFETLRKACSKCGAFYREEQLYVGVCETCLEIPRKKLVIYPYQTKAEEKLRFKAGGKKPPRLLKGPLYLGIELEYESKNLDKSVLEVVKLLDDHAILKHDGSLLNGFEIVTCPATRDVHSEKFELFFSRLSNPEDLFLEARASCGFHVHISKSPLSDLSIGKISAFMNNESNGEFLQGVAERASQYAKQEFYRGAVCFPWTFRKTLHTTERYNVLNLRNKNTLEFRMFAPPTTYQAFQKALDFVEALVEYCLPCNSENTLEKHLHHDQFINFILERHKFYPSLYKFLCGTFPEKFPKPRPIFISKEVKNVHSDL
ncbi:MAG: hypothetical protein A3F67_10875 [Verrucomicrobia bacterium RIFCSPHIGHO2_12_FULL_41_10]|nr:MAG: hypothetical protein A3F67_10875 [Verrucomicrobia bacterium RIFCSPHIGHO2_12_FULL_41_10]